MACPKLLSLRRLIPSFFSPQVEFCGYSIPHPSEAKMNVRIQTYGRGNDEVPSFMRKSIAKVLQKGRQSMMQWKRDSMT